MKRNNDFALRILLYAGLTVFAAMIITVIVVAFGNFTDAKAAVGDQTITKVGSNYVVETVTMESTDSNGVKNQTIEKLSIPESFYNPSNPRVPFGSSSINTNTIVDSSSNTNTIDGIKKTLPSLSKKAKKLKEKAVRELESLSAYASTYGWGMSVEESLTSDYESDVNIDFDQPGWTCHFRQVVRFGKKGKVTVKYEKDGESYSASSIKSMLKKHKRG